MISIGKIYSGKMHIGKMHIGKTGRTLLMCLLIGGLLAGCVTDQPGKGRKDETKLLQNYINLGLGYIRNQEYQRARENFTRAMAIDDRSPVVHNGVAILYQLEQEHDLAETHFKMALRFDPNFTQARNNYGAFLFERNRYEEAIEQLETGASDTFYRGRAQIYENLGVSYARLGRLEEAAAAFEKSLSLNPSQARALLELASLMFDDQQYSEARDLYQRYLSASQQDSRSLWLGIRLARIFDDDNDEASYAMMLKNIFPASDEYREFQESAGEH